MKLTALFAAFVTLACFVGLAGDTHAAGLLHKDCCAPPPCPPPPPIHVILEVCHPCTGCKFEVPVCLPACCCGEPCVNFSKTLIGYGKTTYEWKCGHKVVIRFPHNGGYTVHERG
jgi:hypothetical protein